MSEDMLNKSKFKTLQNNSLPYTMKDHAMKRKWKLKESAKIKKETMCLKKALQSEMNYDKYNIYLCTYHPNKSNNKLVKCLTNKQNLSEFDTFQNSNHSRVKTLINHGSIKLDETVLVQDLEKWQKDKKIPFELYDSKALMKRNKLYQKVKEDIKKDEFFKSSKLLPLTKKESSLYVKLDEQEQMNHIISVKPASGIEVNKKENGQKPNFLLDKNQDYFQANKLTKKRTRNKK